MTLTGTVTTPGVQLGASAPYLSLTNNNGALSANGGVIWPTVPSAVSGQLTWGQGLPSLSAPPASTALTISAGSLAVTAPGGMTLNGTVVQANPEPGPAVTSVAMIFLNTQVCELAYYTNGTPWTVPNLAWPTMPPMGTVFAIQGSISVELGGWATVSGAMLCIRVGVNVVWRGGALLLWAGADGGTGQTTRVCMPFNAVITSPGGDIAFSATVTVQSDLETLTIQTIDPTNPDGRCTMTLTTSASVSTLLSHFS